MDLPHIPELDYQVVMDALKGYAFPRKALSDAIRLGKLTRVKKGIYVRSGPGIPLYSRGVLANMIYGPSYVSYEYALSAHGLIPEGVVEVASATTGKSRFFETPAGRFRYKHQEVHYYSIGYDRQELDDMRGYLMAKPEKALADRVLLAHGRFSTRSMRQFLFENLRIDEVDFRELDSELLGVLAQRSGRQALRALWTVRKEFS